MPPLARRTCSRLLCSHLRLITLRPCKHLSLWNSRLPHRPRSFSSCERAISTPALHSSQKLSSILLRISSIKLGPFWQRTSSTGEVVKNSRRVLMFASSPGIGMAEVSFGLRAVVAESRGPVGHRIVPAKLWHDPEVLYTDDMNAFAKESSLSQFAACACWGYGQ